MNAPPANLWTVREILDYTDNWRATFTVLNGQQAIVFPPELVDRWGNFLKARERQAIIDAVMPHIRARRDELLDYFTPKPDSISELAFPPSDTRDLEAEDRHRRNVILAALLERAASEGRNVWHMTPPTLLPLCGSDVPETAVYVCLEGDSCWLMIPQVGDESEPKAKKKAPRRGRK